MAHYAWYGDCCSLAESRSNRLKYASSERSVVFAAIVCWGDLSDGSDAAALSGCRGRNTDSERGLWRIVARFLSGFQRAVSFDNLRSETMTSAAPLNVRRLRALLLRNRASVGRTPLRRTTKANVASSDSWKRPRSISRYFFWKTSALRNDSARRYMR